MEGGTIPEELRVLVDEKKAKSKANKEEKNAARRRCVPLLNLSCRLFRDKCALASFCCFGRFGGKELGRGGVAESCSSPCICMDPEP